MSDERWAVLIGGLLGTAGGIVGSLVGNWPTTQRDQAKELLESARERFWAGLFGWLVVSLGLGTSCASVRPVTPPLQASPTPSPVEQGASQGSPSFRLHILEQDWSSWSELGYTRESAWPLLREVDLNESSIWVITENDIKVYNWSRHMITLTVEASTALREAFSEREFSRWQGLKQVFVVTLKGDWLYGGVFNEVASAAAIRFPVIYPDFHESSIVLHLSPGWVPVDEWSSTTDRQEVHDFFHDLGKLVE